MRAAVGLLSFAATVCIAAAAFAADRVLRDDAHHFSFERPAGATPLDARFVVELRARTSGMVKVIEAATGKELDWSEVASFGVPRDQGGGPTASVLVSYHRWPSQPRSYGGIEKRFSREVLHAGAVITAELTGTSVPRHDDIVVDRGRGRLSWRGTTTVADVGEVATYGVGLLGKEGVVWLNASTRPADAAAAWPLIDAVADSFRWDDGYAFREEVVTGAVAGPTRWRDDPNRWSVVVPAGWTQRPPQPGDGNRCVATFAPPNAEAGFDPVVIARWIPTEFHRVSWAEFERDVLGADYEELFAASPFAVGSTALKVEWSRPVFDQRRGRLSATFSSEFAGVRWKGGWVNHFGREGGALLLYHAMEKDIASAQPEIDALVDSFRLDDGYRWEDAFPFASFDWWAVGKRAAVVAGIGVLGAVILWRIRAREAKAAGELARKRLLQYDVARPRD